MPLWGMLEEVPDLVAGGGTARLSRGQSEKITSAQPSVEFSDLGRLAASLGAFKSNK